MIRWSFSKEGLERARETCANCQRLPRSCRQARLANQAGIQVLGRQPAKTEGFGTMDRFWLLDVLMKEWEMNQRIQMCMFETRD